jgi:hypothetical protein
MACRSGNTVGIQRRRHRDDPADTQDHVNIRTIADVDGTVDFPRGIRGVEFKAIELDTPETCHGARSRNSGAADTAGIRAAAPPHATTNRPTSMTKTGTNSFVVCISC